MKLAIVIPYYKPEFFGKTLASLAAQTDKRFRVYIGDDASPGNPDALLEKYGPSLDLRYHRFPENLGGKSLVKQWERCVDLAGDEEWVAILGDDDLWEDNCVEAFYKHLPEIEKIQVGVVRYASVAVDESGVEISQRHFHPALEKSPDFLARKLKGGTRSSLSEYLFKKEAVMKTGFRNLPLAWQTDLLGVLEFSAFGFIYTLNEAVVHFRHSGQNITSKSDNLTLKNEATFLFYHYLLMQKKEYFTQAQQELIRFQLEKTLLDNKKNAHLWMLFTKLSWADRSLCSYFRFVERAIRSSLQNFC